MKDDSYSFKENYEDALTKKADKIIKYLNRFAYLVFALAIIVAIVRIP